MIELAAAWRAASVEYRISQEAESLPTRPVNLLMEPGECVAEIQAARMSRQVGCVQPHTMERVV